MITTYQFDLWLFGFELFGFVWKGINFKFDFTITRPKADCSTKGDKPSAFDDTLDRHTNSLRTAVEDDKIKKATPRLEK
jgi:hypothetical protein